MAVHVHHQSECWQSGHEGGMTPLTVEQLARTTSRQKMMMCFIRVSPADLSAVQRHRHRHRHRQRRGRVGFQ
ncbi:hypothetical protein RU50_004840 [Salmonella enterica subsp. enterica]|nr:hypothetical protein [Salmonella enterica subsp. enterica]